MADLFSVTAPLVIRTSAGEQHHIAERFPHPAGLLYFEPFWRMGDPDARIHLVAGEIRGDEPWRVGRHIVQVPACHGTDLCLASEFESWRQYLLENMLTCLPRPLIEAMAPPSARRIDRRPWASATPCSPTS